MVFFFFFFFAFGAFGDCCSLVTCIGLQVVINIYLHHCVGCGIVCGWIGGAGTALPRDYRIESMLQCAVLSHDNIVKNEDRPVFVAFHWASLSLNILNSSLSEDLIPSAHVYFMLIFSKYVNNLSLNIDKNIR